jgi:hypothetical protein
LDNKSSDNAIRDDGDEDMATSVRGATAGTADRPPRATETWQLCEYLRE